MVEFGIQLFAYTKKIQNKWQKLLYLDISAVKNTHPHVNPLWVEIVQGNQMPLVAASILYVPLFRITSAVDTANSFLITVRMMILENIWEFQ